MTQSPLLVRVILLFWAGAVLAGSIATGCARQHDGQVHVAQLAPPADDQVPPPEPAPMTLADLAPTDEEAPAAEAPQAPAEPDRFAEGARLYDGFGNYTRQASTDSADAQRWFDQGLQLLYGFNHDEAIRSFTRATQVDPDMAIAWWGIAYAHGLHINNPEMNEEKSRLAYAAAREAAQRIDHASPPERALIEAVQHRYAAEPPEDRRPLDEAYAEAMGRAWQAHPDDPDIGALYAESLMNLQPWDYWTSDGQPKGRIEEVVQVLERVMEMREDHPGANHFYIHAVEASRDPDRATEAADRLANLVPGSGHLVHMPSHIYVRTGRWTDAAIANEKASAVDEAYFAKAPPPDFYSLYYLHNLHFLAYASMMEARYEASMEAARRLEKQVPQQFLREYVTIADGIMPTALHVMVRFGRWQDILDEPEPPEYRLVSRAMRHYARGVALANLDRTDEAVAELEAFDELAGKIGEEWMVGNNPSSTVLAMARGMLAGELAFHQNRREDAFTLLRQAAEREDELVYDEPPGWMQPVRHALGALLLADERWEEAEQVFRDDLERHPHNGWALLGLEQSLAAQGREAEEQEVAGRREAAFARSDVTPPSACYCHPSGQRDARSSR